MNLIWDANAGTAGEFVLAAAPAATPWVTNGNDISYQGGNVGIGTNANAEYSLAVAGDVITEKVKVKIQAEWPDYVFDDNYEGLSLEQLETYVDEHNSLPNIPTTQEVGEMDGIDLGEMNRLLLEKVEELTLYLIDQNKVNQQQSNEIQALKKELEKLTGNQNED